MPHTNRLKWGLPLLVSLAGCLGHSALKSPIVLPQAIQEKTSSQSSLGCHITQSQIYHTEFLRQLDWINGDVTLSNAGSGYSHLQGFNATTVSTLRTADILFTSLSPPGPFNISVRLYRLDADNNPQVVASGVQNGLLLSPGANTVNVTLNATFLGESNLGVPALSFSLPALSLRALNDTSDSPGAVITLAGSGFSSIAAQDQVTFNGVPATVRSAGPDALQVVVPGGAASGVLQIISQGKTVVGPVFTVVPDGSVISNFPFNRDAIGIAFDSVGNAWITNYADGKVLKMAPNGNILGTYSPGGAGPVAIVLDNLDNAWVLYSSSNEVQKLNNMGGSLGTFATPGAPQSLAIDKSTGNVWVPDTASNTVTVLGPSGSVVGVYPTDNQPQGVAIDQAGNGWIVTTNSRKLDVITTTGTRLGTYPLTGWGPTNIVLDPSGNAWITNRNSDTVSEIASNGSPVVDVPVGHQPDGDAVDQNGDIWAIDTGASSVTKISSTGLVIGTYPLGLAPKAVAIAPDNHPWITEGMAATAVLKLAP